jgi:hypothetical protein
MLAAIEMDYANRLELLNDNIFQELEAERMRLDEKYRLEIEAAEAIGGDTALITERYEKNKLLIQKQTEAAKFDIASKAFGDIASLFGKNTKVAKAAAAAQTAIETYKGAISAYSSLAGIPIVGPVLGGIAAAAVVASGAKAIKNIYNTKSGLPGDGGGGSASVANTTVPGVGNATRAASINDGGVVNRDTVSSKENMKQAFSEALAETPVKTAVVVDEVEAKMLQRSNNAKMATI